MQQTDIVSVVSDGWGAPLAVQMHSVRENGGLCDLPTWYVYQYTVLSEQERGYIINAWPRVEFCSLAELGELPQHVLTICDRDSLRHVWANKLLIQKATRHRKMLLLDVDIICIGNIAELLDMPDMSAAPDDFGVPVDLVNGEKKINAGVLVFSPNEATYDSMMTWIRHNPDKFGLCDQDCINYYMRKHEPGRLKIINGCWNTMAKKIRNRPEFEIVAKLRNVRLLHYTGVRKPWHFKPYTADWSQRVNENEKVLFGAWWDIANKTGIEQYQPILREV